MTRQTVGPAGSQAPADRIGLLMQSGRDRQLLADWLDTLPRYSVAVSDPGTALPEECDLYVFDLDGLDRHRSELRARQQDMEADFLPCLLVVPERATEAASELTNATEHEQPLVNDVVALPIGQAALHRRIENLLHARRAVCRLREREEQYQQLVNLAPEAILIVRDDHVVYNNAAAADIFDFDDAAARHLALTELVSEAGRSRFVDLLDRIERGTVAEEFVEFDMESATGEPIRAEVAGVSVTFDGEPAVQLLVRDVTAERERRQRLDLFGRAIQAASQGVTISDARQDDNPLIYANDAFEHITGYSTTEILGENCRFLQGDETDAETVARLRRAIDAEQPVSVEILNYRKNGTPFWNHVDIVPVRNDDGVVTHFLGLQRDITERRAQQERLQVLGRVLRHNVRNRMNVVVGYTERLQNSTDPDAAAAAETISKSASSLLSLSKQIDDFNGVISEDAMEFESHDLAALLRTVTTGFRSTYPDATVRLDLPDSASVRGHGLLPAALEELFELTVVDGGAAPNFDITVRSDGDWWTATLTDYGETVPDHELQVLETEVETPVEHPEGLELWLVRWTVLRSGGELTVTRGAPPEITVRLPTAGADVGADGR